MRSKQFAVSFRAPADGSPPASYDDRHFGVARRGSRGFYIDCHRRVNALRSTVRLTDGRPGVAFSAVEPMMPAARVIWRIIAAADYDCRSGARPHRLHETIGAAISQLSGHWSGEAAADTLARRRRELARRRAERRHAPFHAMPGFEARAATGRRRGAQSLRRRPRRDLISRQPEANRQSLAGRGAARDAFGGFL